MSGRGAALAGAGLGLLALVGALWPAHPPPLRAWPVAAAGGGRALARAIPMPVAPGRTALAADRPAVAPPTADHRLDRPPSISAARIDRILAAYGSPAAGQGAALYDLGVQAGIDPAYALAFFIHESAAGTRGVARSTHSLGNIRCTSGYACVAGYRAYPTWVTGMADWYNLIKELYISTWGLHTPAAITPRYAPWGDGNNPTLYAATVMQLVDSWREGQ